MSSAMGCTAANAGPVYKQILGLSHRQHQLAAVSSRGEQWVPAQLEQPDYTPLVHSSMTAHWMGLRIQ